MPTVTSTVLDPDDQPVPDVRVRVDLVGTDEAGYVGADEYMVSGSLVMRTQGDGTWQATLLPNALITDPAGSCYQVTEYGAGRRPLRTYHITVPDGPGPYQAGDL